MKKFLIIIIAAAAAAGLLYINYNRTVNIVFTGDILLDRGVKSVIEKNGTDYPYDKVKSVIKKADIAFGNLECPLTFGGTPVLKKPYLVFKCQPSNAEALKNSGYDILNLANNHVMDYGYNGINDTMENLEKNGIMYVGAGVDRQDAYKPLIIKKKGIKIGIVSYSDFPPEGYVYSESHTDIARTDEKMMYESIKYAKKHCDFLIVSFHWGTEYSFYPGDLQKKYAHEVIDYGADMVVGHHPHVLESIEKYNNKYIFYSLGNFVFDKQIYPGTDESAVLWVQLSKNGVKKVEITPVIIKNCQPEIAEGEDAVSILNKLEQYSENKGADMKININNKLVINL